MSLKYALTHFRMFGQDGFNLCKLDAVSPNLYLIVYATKALDPAIRQIAG